MTENANVIKTIKEESVEYVDIRFTDPRGKLQHVTVMADQVDEDFLEEGFMFDGSSIAGWKSIDQSDMKLMPDSSSFYIDPFYGYFLCFLVMVDVEFRLFFWIKKLC